MNYLNQLGANVRNHMSTIDDKFVEQAREAFPLAQKKSRLTGQTSAASSSAPTASVSGTTLRKEAATTVTAPVKTGSPAASREEEKAQPAKPAAPRTDRPAQTQQPAGTNQGQPTKSTTQPVRPTNAAKPTATPTAETKADIAPTQNQARPQAPAKQPGTAAAVTRRGNQPATNVPKPSHQRPAPAGEKREGQRPSAAEGRNRPQPQRPGGQQRQQQSEDNDKQRRSVNERGVKSQQPEAHKERTQTNKSNRQQTGAQRGNDNRNNRPQSVINQKGGSGRTQQHPVLPAKPKGPHTNVKSVQLPEHMTVKDFAQLLELAASDIIKKLMGLGLMATINQELDLDTMMLIADEFGIAATAAPTEEEQLQVEEVEDDPASLVKRSPVVTIMGHVDHGKTSLLDAIRETNVTASEAGGITQHIGAYQVELNERKITFLDTPGHAAFTAMRARGAQVTDIAVLVVAADDGVMPQTVEAINHAKDANVSIIVAVNKIDKPGANVDRIKQEMTEHGLVAEEWGGDTIFVPVSAKQRIGIENLLEMILLVADMKELKANPNRPAKGTIIEAKLDKGRGPVATVLVQNGTLELGDSIIAGAAFGKVRALINDKGKRVKKAGPSTPVEVIGFDELPEAGDILNVISEERLARQLADKRMQLKRENELLQNQKVTLNDLFSKIKEGAIKELKLIIKADVQGSVEAIRQSLERLSNDEVKVKVIHGGVGAIGEGDVTFASAANAIIIGFNVRPDANAKRIAEKENVDIQLYRVIYNIIEDVQKAMDGMLEPEYKEVITGRAEVRAVYKVPKVGNIAGSYVLEGKINRNNEIRLLRDNIVIHEGKIESLKRFKDDVREVAEGFECGIGIANFNDIKEGDIIEAFEMEEIKRTKQ